MRTSCCESVKLGSFWIYLGAVNQFLRGLTSNFLQTSTMINSGLILFVDLPSLPKVGWTLPSVVGGAAISLYVTVGTTVADAMSNYVIKHRDELNTHAHLLAQPGLTISEPERVDTTDGESAHLGAYDAEAQNETTPLTKPKKPSKSCCCKSRGCCEGLTIFQKNWAAGDIMGHALEATNWMFYLWLAVKVIFDVDSNLVTGLITLISIIAGIPASMADNDTCITNLRDYNKLMIIREIRKSQRIEEPQETASNLNNSLAPN